jgi:fructokinase
VDKAYGAIELGGTKVRCAYFVADTVVHEISFPTASFEQTMTDIGAFFTPLRTELSALGVASFGPLELRQGGSRGCLLATPKPGWSEAPLLPSLVQMLSLPVFIDTDVNAAALAEQTLGAARERDPCVYITVGTGIGVGVVVHGKPLHGLMHPELGHLPAPDLCDFRGACPFHGRCLEGVASGHALGVRTGGRADALSDDDPLWELEARYLAQLVTTCVLAYAPERVVLGGGVLQRRALYERIRHHVHAQLGNYVPRSELSTSGLRGYLVSPGLGDRAGLLGALLLAQRGLS